MLLRNIEVFHKMIIINVRAYNIRMFVSGGVIILNIYDISKKAGVSIATVSRVLNNSSRVSGKTREKVLQVMEECGYTPNVFARSLGLNTMKTIGIMCADSSYPYQAKAVYFMEQRLREKGYDCLLCCTGDGQIRREECMQLLITKKVDGIILIGSAFIGNKDEDALYIKKAGETLPVMLLNGRVDAPNIYCVVTDDEKAMENATIHLLDNGEGEIIYLFNVISDSGRRKQEGFKRACLRKGILKPEDKIYFLSGYHEDIPFIAGRLSAMYKNGNTFCKVLCSDDSLAMGVLRFAYEENIEVPGKLQVMGYGDSMLVHCCNPELSSVDTKEEAMCNTLVDTLIDVLHGGSKPQVQIFSGDVILRGTTL